MLHGIDNLGSDKLFGKSEDLHLKGHGVKLFKQQVQTTCWHKFFSQQVLDRLNSLPAKAVSAPSVESFKCRLDKHLGHYKLTACLAQQDEDDDDDSA